MSIRVLICDDQALVRGGFKAILSARPDIEIVGEAANGLEAVALADRRRPDVILMDIRMPILDGVEATHQLVAKQTPARILILTTFDLDEYVHAAIRAGASGFLLKDVKPAELEQAVRVVAAGDALLGPIRDAPPPRALREHPSRRRPHSRRARRAHSARKRRAPSRRPRTQTQRSLRRSSLATRR